MKEEEYVVEVLKPDGAVAEQHIVYGAVEASEFLEDRLRGHRKATKGASGG